VCAIPTTIPELVTNVFDTPTLPTMELTVNDCCGDGKMVVVTPLFGAQVKARPLIVTSSPTLKL
jgi:hypothetical protein